MILITGAAGFIGYHFTRKLVESRKPSEIIAIDNFNSYYSPALKKARAERLLKDSGVEVKCVDITDFNAVQKLIDPSIDTIVHLAAQAGIRYSIEQPRAYIDANIVGFTNVLDAARLAKVNHILYASSSSVYGNESSVPFRESNPLTSFESLYAVTKASNEMIAQVFSKLYGLQITGLRFFTVYGSWGRPDMAYYSFADAIENGRSIDVYNNGNLERDFTHVSDIVDGMTSILRQNHDKLHSGESRIYNIGRGEPIRLMEFISTIEDLLGKQAEKVFKPMQPGDVHSTWADVSALKRDYGYEPRTSLKEGLNEFVHWYREYHGAR